MRIRINSIYAQRTSNDGYRVLVDDYLPDSMDEQRAGVDLWLKKIMPSQSLVNLLRNNPGLWELFKSQYFKELDDEKQNWVKLLARIAMEGTVTLYYSSNDRERNNAVAIKEYIEANMERLGRKAA